MEEAKAPVRRGAKSAKEAAPLPQEERIVKLPLTVLHDFPNHPFKVRDDEAMLETAESIRQYGALVLAIVRPREDGGYEIVAGHRRKHGSELAGLQNLPCIVRKLDNDTATILMVDSNIRRENILPSERAQAYKMKLEAIKRQGARTDLTSPQVAAKFRADDEVAKGADVSGDTVRRYIRLTELSPGASAYGWYTPKSGADLAGGKRYAYKPSGSLSQSMRPFENSAGLPNSSIS